MTLWVPETEDGYFPGRSKVEDGASVSWCLLYVLLLVSRAASAGQWSAGQWSQQAMPLPGGGVHSWELEPGVFVLALAVVSLPTG